MANIGRTNHLFPNKSSRKVNDFIFAFSHLGRCDSWSGVDWFYVNEEGGIIEKLNRSLNVDCLAWAAKIEYEDAWLKYNEETGNMEFHEMY